MISDRDRKAAYDPCVGTVLIRMEWQLLMNALDLLNSCTGGRHVWIRLSSDGISEQIAANDERTDYHVPLVDAFGEIASTRIARVLGVRLNKFVLISSWNSDYTRTAFPTK